MSAQRQKHENQERKKICEIKIKMAKSRELCCLADLRQGRATLVDGIKYWIMTAVGLAGSAIASLFGGWTNAMTTLIIFMAIDYITGVIVAGVFKNSLKSESGALESKAGFKGLCRKGTVLLILLVSCRLDRLMGTEYLKNAVCIAFIVNETFSIMENAGLMGIPIPSPLKKAIDIFRNKEQ